MSDKTDRIFEQIFNYYLLAIFFSVAIFDIINLIAIFLELIK